MCENKLKKIKMEQIKNIFYIILVFIINYNHKKDLFFNLCNKNLMEYIINMYINNI